VLVVYAYGGDILTSGGTNIVEELMERKYISPTHAFVIAIGNEGARIFQVPLFTTRSLGIRWSNGLSKEEQD
jgi:hypothetical protein